MHTVIPTQVYGSTLGLVDPHQVPLCPVLYSVQVSLSGSTVFPCGSYFCQLCIMNKLAEGELHPFIQNTDEQDLTQQQPLWNTTSFRPITRLCSAHCDALISVRQPILNPPHCLLIYLKLPKYTYENIMGDTVNSLAEVKVDNIHCNWTNCYHSH